MVKKNVVRVAKLQFTAGQAKPGPALAGLGIVMPEFTKKFNDKTKSRGSEPVPVKITIFKDKSFDFQLFTAPTSYKIKQAAKIESGAKKPNNEKVGKISFAQLKEIAEYKLPDLNTDDINKAILTVYGTCKQMGVEIENIEEFLKSTK
ncbi:50S ribosomal protein L11 [Mycoplasma flocculare]|uniref:Large ribosomal subunit protein uL11 n=2 Tax=Mesomycoplasma flocculare TaxID=2128 RepID=A0A0A8E846_MESFC|nr:50S ribosomal protein L11 [Mesomycoplasma flocculare]MXR39406.1 50S ribosomal protein L11 [Mycoplasma sp. MF12]AJC49787.1 50S ribosomal protein L11 [Mesomycoplasma flocculare ATCC 27399]MXR05819.1 50S ribosomal protein L11 [Mesomycoplasma flocculare]MXR13453.1 50S ribosomal protein L11 [Mesomycoplasma flocculare]MXR22786.1 50S ribosomal protein L11 [Mesomycoplasma flocculare]